MATVVFRMVKETLYVGLRMGLELCLAGSNNISPHEPLEV